MYEDWKNEDITRNEYLEYKKEYERDIERLKQNIKNLQIEKQKYENQHIINNKWIETFKKKKSITELSRDIVMELIDTIYVKENGDLTIKFKFKNEMKKYIKNI